MSTLPFSGPGGREAAVTPEGGGVNTPVSHTISARRKTTP